MLNNVKRLVLAEQKKPNDNKFTLVMLDDINRLLLDEQKKPNILIFSIQPKNKHHLRVLKRPKIVTKRF